MAGFGSVRLAGVSVLSLCLILVGCGYSPTTNPAEATVNRIVASAAFESAAAALYAEGISVSAESVFQVDAENGTALFQASEAGTFVYARYDGTDILSASVMSFAEGDWYVYNALTDVRAEGTYGELEHLSKLDVGSLDGAVLPASVSNPGAGLAAAMGYSDVRDSDDLLEAQCAACQSERNSRNWASAGLVAASAALTLAIAGLAGCVAPIACPVAIASYLAADAAMLIASAAFADAQSNLDRCIREQC